MVADARDIEIPLDSYVRYVDTGTVGKVLDVKTQGDMGWVKLDKTDLWYCSNRVELLDEKDIKKGFWADNKEVDIEDLKDGGLNFEEMDISQDACNGGG